MPWIRTPEAPHGPRQCRTLRFRLPLREIESATSNTFDFGANHSIHLHSGLPFPCLRFAVSVATPHARLGTWLLARLCHGSHLRLLNFVRFQGATLIEPGGPLSGTGLSDKASSHRTREIMKHGIAVARVP